VGKARAGLKATPAGRASRLAKLDIVSKISSYSVTRKAVVAYGGLVRAVSVSTILSKVLKNVRVDCPSQVICRSNS
jgi:hypothetical protein